MGKANVLQVFPEYTSAFSGAQSRILRVGKSLQSNFLSISGAVANARPFDRIEIEAGEYFETVSITFPLELVGSNEGNKPVITTKGLCLTINADGPVLVDNLKIVTKASLSVSSLSILVVHGNPTIQNCELCSLQVTNYSKPVVYSCVIANSEVGVGLKVMDHAGGEYTQNLICNHNEESIRIQTIGSPIFMKNKILQNSGRSKRSAVTFAPSGLIGSSGQTIFTDNIVCGGSVVSAEEGVEEALRIGAEELTNPNEITSSDSLVFVTETTPILRGNFLCNGIHGFHFSRVSIGKDLFTENRIAACRGWAIVVEKRSSIVVERNDVQKCGGACLVRHNKCPPKKNRAHGEVVNYSSSYSGEAAEDETDSEDLDTGSLIMSPEAFGDLVRTSILARPENSGKPRKPQWRKTKNPVCICKCTFRHNYQFGMYVVKSHVELMETTFSENRVGLHLSVESGRSSIYENDFVFNLIAAVVIADYGNIKLVGNRISGGNIANTRVLLESCGEETRNERGKLPSPEQNTSAFGVRIVNYSRCTLLENRIKGSVINVSVEGCSSVHLERNEMQDALNHHVMISNHSSLRLFANIFLASGKAAVVLSRRSRGQIIKNSFRAMAKEGAIVEGESSCIFRENSFSACNTSIRICSGSRCVAEQNQLMLGFHSLSISGDDSSILLTNNRFFTVGGCFIEAVDRCVVESRQNRFEGSLGPSIRAADGVFLSVEKCTFKECPGGFIFLQGFHHPVEASVSHCAMEFCDKEGIIALGHVNGQIHHCTLGQSLSAAFFSICTTSFEFHDNQISGCAAGMVVGGDGKIFRNSVEGWSSGRREYTVIGLHAACHTTASFFDMELKRCHVGIVAEQDAAASFEHISVDCSRDAGILVHGKAQATLFKEVKVSLSETAGVVVRNGASCKFEHCYFSDAAQASLIACAAGEVLFEDCSFTCAACEAYVDRKFRLPIEYGSQSYHFSKILFSFGAFYAHLKNLENSPCGESLTIFFPYGDSTPHPSLPSGTESEGRSSRRSPSPFQGAEEGCGPVLSRCTVGSVATRQGVVAVNGKLCLQESTVTAPSSRIMSPTAQHAGSGNEVYSNVVPPFSSGMQAGCGVISLNYGSVEARGVRVVSCTYAGVVMQRRSHSTFFNSVVESCRMGLLLLSSEGPSPEIFTLKDFAVSLLQDRQNNTTAMEDASFYPSVDLRAREAGFEADTRPSSGAGLEAGFNKDATSFGMTSPYSRFNQTGAARTPPPTILTSSCFFEGVTVRDSITCGVQFSAQSGGWMTNCAISSAVVGIRIGDAAELHIKNVKVSQCRSHGVKMFGYPLTVPFSHVDGLEVYDCEGFGVYYIRKPQKENYAATVSTSSLKAFNGNGRTSVVQNTRRMKRPVSAMSHDWDEQSPTSFTSEEIDFEYPPVLLPGTQFFREPSPSITTATRDGEEKSSLGEFSPESGERLVNPVKFGHLLEEQQKISIEEGSKPATVVPQEEALSSMFHFQNTILRDNVLGEVLTDGALCFVGCTITGNASPGVLICGPQAQLHAYTSLFTDRTDGHVVVECGAHLYLSSCGVEKSKRGVIILEAGIAVIHQCVFRELDSAVVCSHSSLVLTAPGSPRRPSMISLVTSVGNHSRDSKESPAIPTPKPSAGESKVSSVMPGLLQVSHCDVVQSTFENCGEGLVFHDGMLTFHKEWVRILLDLKKNTLRAKNRGEKSLFSPYRLRLLENRFCDISRGGCRINGQGAHVHLSRCEFLRCAAGIATTTQAKRTVVMVMECNFTNGTIGAQFWEGSDIKVTQCRFGEQTKAGVAITGGEEVDVYCNDFCDHPTGGGGVLIDVSIQTFLLALSRCSGVAKMEAQRKQWESSQLGGVWMVRGNLFSKCDTAVRMPSGLLPSFLVPVIEIYRNYIKGCNIGVLCSKESVESVMVEEVRAAEWEEAAAVLLSPSAAYQERVGFGPVSKPWYISMIQNRWEENGVGVEITGEGQVVVWHSQFIANRNHALRVDGVKGITSVNVIDCLIERHGEVEHVDYLFSDKVSSDSNGAIRLRQCDGHLCMNTFQKNQMPIYVEAVGSKEAPLIIGGNRFLENQRTLCIVAHCQVMVLHNTFLKTTMCDVHVVQPSALHEIIVAYNAFLSPSIPISVLCDVESCALLYRNLFTANSQIAVQINPDASIYVVECFFYAVGIGVKVEVNASLQAVGDYFIQHAEAAILALEKSTIFIQRCGFVAYPDHKTVVLGKKSNNTVDASLFLGSQRIIELMDSILLSRGTSVITRCRFDGKQPSITVDSTSSADIRYCEFYGGDTGIDVRRDSTVNIEDNVFWLTRFGAINLQARTKGFVKNNDMPENSIIAAPEHEVLITMPKTALDESPFSSNTASNHISQCEEKLLKLYALLLTEAPSVLPWNRQSEGTSPPLGTAEPLFFQAVRPEDAYICNQHSLDPNSTKTPLLGASPDQSLQSDIQTVKTEQDGAMKTEQQSQVFPAVLDESAADASRLISTTSTIRVVPAVEKPQRPLLEEITGDADPFFTLLQLQHSSANIGDTSVLTIEPREKIEGSSRKTKGGKQLAARKPPKEKISAQTHALLDAAARVHNAECQTFVDRTRRAWIQYQQSPLHFLPIVPWTAGLRLSDGSEFLVQQSSAGPTAVVPKASKLSPHHSTGGSTLGNTRNTEVLSDTSISKISLDMSKTNGSRKEDAPKGATLHQMKVLSACVTDSPSHTFNIQAAGSKSLPAPSHLLVHIETLLQQLRAIQQNEGEHKKAMEEGQRQKAQETHEPLEHGAEITDIESSRDGSTVWDERGSTKRAPFSTPELQARARRFTKERSPESFLNLEMDKISKEKTEDKTLLEENQLEVKRLHQVHRPIISTNLKLHHSPCLTHSRPGKCVDMYEKEMREKKIFAEYCCMEGAFPSYSLLRFEVEEGFEVDLFVKVYARPILSAVKSSESVETASGSGLRSEIRGFSHFIGENEVSSSNPFDFDSVDSDLRPHGRRKRQSDSFVVLPAKEGKVKSVKDELETDLPAAIIDEHEENEVSSPDPVVKPKLVAESVPPAKLKRRKNKAKKGITVEESIEKPKKKRKKSRSSQGSSTHQEGSQAEDEVVSSVGSPTAEENQKSPKTEDDFDINLDGFGAASKKRRPVAQRRKEKEPQIFESEKPTKFSHPEPITSTKVSDEKSPLLERPVLEKNTNRTEIKGFEKGEVRQAKKNTISVPLPKEKLKGIEQSYVEEESATENAITKVEKVAQRSTMEDEEEWEYGVTKDGKKTRHRKALGLKSKSQHLQTEKTSDIDTSYVQNENGKWVPLDSAVEEDQWEYIVNENGKKTRRKKYVNTESGETPDGDVTYAQDESGKRVPLDGEAEKDEWEYSFTKDGRRVRRRTPRPLSGSLQSGYEDKPEVATVYVQNENGKWVPLDSAVEEEQWEYIVNENGKKTRRKKYVNTESGETPDGDVTYAQDESGKRVPLDGEAEKDEWEYSFTKDGRRVRRRTPRPLSGSLQSGYEDKPEVATVYVQNENGKWVPLDTSMDGSEVLNNWVLAADSVQGGSEVRNPKQLSGAEPKVTPMWEYAVTSAGQRIRRRAKRSIEGMSTSSDKVDESMYIQDYNGKWVKQDAAEVSEEMKNLLFIGSDGSSSSRVISEPESEESLELISLTPEQLDKKREELWGRVCEILQKCTAKSPKTEVSSPPAPFAETLPFPKVAREEAREGLTNQLQNLSTPSAHQAIRYLGNYRSIGDYEDVIAIFHLLSYLRLQREAEARHDVYSLLRRQSSIFFFEGESTAERPFVLPLNEGSTDMSRPAGFEQGPHLPFTNAEEQKKVLDRRPYSLQKFLHPFFQDQHPGTALNLKNINYSSEVHSSRKPVAMCKKGAFNGKSYEGRVSYPIRVIYLGLPPAHHLVPHPAEPEGVSLNSSSTSVPFLAIKVQDGVGVVDLGIQDIPVHKIPAGAASHNKPRDPPRIVSMNHPQLELKDVQIGELLVVSAPGKWLHDGTARHNSDDGPFLPFVPSPPGIFECLGLPTVYSKHALKSSRTGAEEASGAPPGPSGPAQLPTISEKRTQKPWKPSFVQLKPSEKEAAEQLRSQMDSSLVASSVKKSQDDPFVGERSRSNSSVGMSSMRRSKSPRSSSISIHSFNSLSQDADRAPPIASLSNFWGCSTFDPGRPAETTPFTSNNRPLTYVMLPSMNLREKRRKLPSRAY